MTSRIKGRGLVFLDACCLINLFATGRAAEILQALPYRFAVARYVAEEEALQIRSATETGGSDQAKERIALKPMIAELISKGILERVDLATPKEEVEMLYFAAQLDDGEAMTCALAVTRDALVATDDRKAIRVLSSSRSQSPQILRTSELLFSWAEEQGIGEEELVEIVQAIARRGSFFPPKADPHFDRWLELLRREA
jgi:predicted nucleic acid-binding protein